VKPISVTKRVPDDNTNAACFSKDIARLVQILENQGLFCTKEQAQELWERRSDAMCACWLILPKEDAQVLLDIKPYFTVVETY
jgi:hypothetical protein